MLFRKESSGFCKSVVILYPNFTNFPHNILEIQYAGLLVDKYYIMLGKLSCVCGSVRISYFQIHITKTVTFSVSHAPRLLVIWWYLFKDGFSKAHQPNYTIKGKMFILSVTLHDYITAIIQSFNWMYSLICTQSGGGDDHQIKERLSYNTVHVYIRSIVKYIV